MRGQNLQTSNVNLPDSCITSTTSSFNFMSKVPHTSDAGPSFKSGHGDCISKTENRYILLWSRAKQQNPSLQDTTVTEWKGISVAKPP